MVRVCLPGFVLLLFVLQVVAVVRANSEDNLVRKRREWILPARNLMENVDYIHQEYIARIRSDHESESNIHYSLEGIGANQYPFHVFVVDPKTGLIRVTQVLDREIIDTYNLSGVATYTSGQHAEKKIDIRIKVLDENDNSPVFGVINSAEVYELSPKGMSVMKVIATDADEPGNENSQIAYSIIAQNPPHDMFNMSSNGTIYTNKHTLDRETQDQYILTVKGQDLNGKPEGKTGTGTVTIFVLDVNDNPPTLEKEQYEGSIEENTQGVEVMRLKAQDLDLKGTDNWEAVFDIVKGNEAGYFSIKTDPNTNEGILMLDKSVDYEDVKDLDLGIVLRNKAPLHDRSGTFSQTSVNFGSGTIDATGALSSQSGKQLKTYPVKINVKNQPEGPRFDPKVKAIPISEGAQINLRDVIGRYPAIDGDTGKPAENVKYAKGLDPDNWLIIDPTTAEIRLNKKPDRESKFLVNGTYTAQVLCITEDMPAKTATGTIAIQVEDYNDHCPTLTSNSQTMCTTDDAVIVNAEDEDADPNGPPFDFAIVPEGTRGKWQVEHLNDTAAILRAQESLWPGYYEVEFVVTDEQGQACPDPQKVKVVVCTCEDGAVCSRRGAYSQPTKKAELGPAAIGLLLLGLLILLLIPLLLLNCTCGWGEALTGNFMEMPFDTKSHFINYHTEGQGENTVVPLMNMPMHEQTLVDVNNFKLGMGTGIINGNGTSAAVNSITSIDGMNMSHYQEDFVGRGEIWESFRDSSGIYFNELGNRATKLGHGGIYDGMALSDHILGEYYSQKVDSRNENLAVKDGQLVSNYEGQGSAAGSVGCCSLLESDNDLQFLDDLGPKFKTLAEVCGGVTIPTEVKQVSNPLPSTSINTQTSVSSVVSVPELPSPPKLQSTIQKTNQTVVRETSERSQVVKESTATLKGGMTTVNQGLGNQGQMLLLQQQQPVYYTTTPVLQPMHYVVQPQVQNTVLLAEAPATNLQSMVLVNGAQTGPIQSVVVQGQTLMSSAQPQGPGMVLLERSGGQGGNVKLIQAGNLSGTKTMMITEGKVPTGSVKVLKESHTTLMQGHTLQQGGLSGSQRILVVEPTISGGQLVKEAESLSQKSNVSGTQQVLLNMDNTFTSPQTNVVGSSTTTMSKTPIYRKVVVEETKEIH